MKETPRKEREEEEPHHPSLPMAQTGIKAKKSFHFSPPIKSFLPLQISCSGADQQSLRPIQEQLRETNVRLGKLQQAIDVMQYQQRERDSNSNINRDLVVLVVLVVMIQAVLNWVLTRRASQYAGEFEAPPSSGS